MSDNAVAIIGLSCRFPGAPDARAFWRLLESGTDAIREVPPDRWDIDAFYDPEPGKPGKMNTRWGGFIDGVAELDPQFFGLSPREVEAMDPQQRLVLEVAFEALQDAGIAPVKIRGQKAGVFVGVQATDYFTSMVATGAELDAYSSTGNAHSILANRLSYLLDLRGPSLAVDTACSSALVAVHLACRSLQSGDATLAIAGGVNLILSPSITIALSQARMMAADGRCKAFDARADGYVRGEGCGMVVLKRLSDAVRDRDPIWAVIRGTAVNQDGRSNGLTAPNGPAQEAVIASALEDAAVLPHEIDYVEAHGTGTALGDPIEIQALGAALGSGRDRPLWVGTAKSSIGHLESASGIAGLIKVLLAMNENAIPPNLHLIEPNPKLGLESLPIAIPTQLRPWPRSRRRRLAGVSSFGFGGTNAHAIVEEAPQVVPTPSLSAPRSAHVMVLSGRTVELMREDAARLSAHVSAEPWIDLADAAYTRNVGRDPLLHRLAIVARSTEELEARLSAFAEGRSMEGVFTGQRKRKPPKIAFSFTGQGAQAHGMGRALYETEPSFRRTLDRLAAIAETAAGRPILPVIYGKSADPAIHQTSIAQVALFIVEYALQQHWRALGVEPAVVLGHSLGEIVAAAAAGCIAVEDAVRLVVERGRLMQECGGKMAAVFAPPSLVHDLLGNERQAVSIAAINEPEHVVISGSEAAIARVIERLEAAKAIVRPLKVSGAFHSPEMDPVLDRFGAAIGGIAFSAPSIPWVSNLTAGRMLGAPDAGYWVRHVRQPVRFQEGVEKAAELGATIFLEIGPSNTLSQLGKRCLPAGAATFVPSLSPSDESSAYASAAAALCALGVEIDWAAFDRAQPRSKLRLPPLPYQKERFWFRPGTGTMATPVFRSLYQQIRERAIEAPQRTAVIAGDGTKVSYRELVARAEGIASRLSAAGVRPGAGARVAVLAAPSPQIAIGLVGVLAAGAAAMPIDPERRELTKSALNAASVTLAQAQVGLQMGVDPAKMIALDAGSGGALARDGEAPGGAAAKDAGPEAPAARDGEALGDAAAKDAGPEASTARDGEAPGGAAAKGAGPEAPTAHDGEAPGRAAAKGAGPEAPTARDGEAPGGAAAKDAGPKAAPVSRPDEVAIIVHSSEGARSVTERGLARFLSELDVLDPRLLALERSKIANDQSSRPWLAHIDASDPGSLLHLLSILARGETVAFPRAANPAVSTATPAQPIAMSLLYMAQEESGDERYRLLLDGARFADQHDFSAVWMQEAHFHEIGGIYPNAAVTAAAIAAITRKVAIRGSVMVPLHHPIRLAEEWAMIDRLAGGRAGIAFNASVHPDEYVLGGNRFEERHRALTDGVITVRSLLGGERFATKDRTGKELELEVRPRPEQRAFPIWMSAGCEDVRYEFAAELGIGVIAPVAAMRFDELERRIALYRRLWREHGHPGEGHVTVMIHAFLGESVGAVKETVKEPMLRQLKLTAQRLAAISVDAPVRNMSEAEIMRFAELAFDQQFEKSGLFGTPEGVLAKIEAYRRIGVDEIACLIDFGVPAELVTASLPHLARALRLANPAVESEADRAGMRVQEVDDSLSRALSELGKSVSERFVPPRATPSDTSQAKATPAAAPPAETGEGYVPPRNATERRLAEIWSAVLRVRDVGIHDNFVDIGGDSRLGIEIVRAARDSGLALDPLDLFEHQTIAAIAEKLDSTRDAD